MPHRRPSRRTLAGRGITAVIVVGLTALGGLTAVAWMRSTTASGTAGPRMLARPSLVDTARIAGPSIGEIDDPASAAETHSPDERHWFDGRPIRPARVLMMRVTAYSPDARSCAPFDDGISASGYSVWTNGMKFVAADTRLLPFGTLVSVPGYDDGRVVPVLDRGGRIKGHRLDVLMPTHEIARRWGVRDLPVTVWEYADGKPAGFRPPR